MSGTLTYTSAGVYAVTLTVSDGSLTATDTFTWTVTNTNRQPIFSTDFGDRTDTEGAAINFDADATDPDGDTLTYSATNLPDGISINPSTGVVLGTLEPDQLGCLQRHPDRLRRLTDCHRHLHLDGHRAERP